LENSGLKVDRLKPAGIQTQILPTRKGVASGNPSLLILTRGFAHGAATCDEKDAAVPATAFILREITAHLKGLGLRPKDSFNRSERYFQTP
jgi:hypothetical protein